MPESTSQTDHQVVGIVEKAESDAGVDSTQQQNATGREVTAEEFDSSALHTCSLERVCSGSANYQQRRSHLWRYFAWLGRKVRWQQQLLVAILVVAAAIGPRWRRSLLRRRQ